MGECGNVESDWKVKQEETPYLKERRKLWVPPHCNQQHPQPRLPILIHSKIKTTATSSIRTSSSDQDLTIPSPLLQRFSAVPISLIEKTKKPFAFLLFIIFIISLQIRSFCWNKTVVWKLWKLKLQFLKVPLESEVPNQTLNQTNSATNFNGNWRLH